MLTFYITTCTTLTVILLLLTKTLPSINLDLSKSSPYECGFDPINSARLPFSFRFFLVAILFLIFDLEIALLIATPFFFSAQTSNINALSIIIFLLILTIGLWYEWENDGLDWVC
uniref:NADH-ubiquinone oxidoreductase chain 3 n=1 Tax=Ophiothrix sp. TaxID=2909811 RepID=A0AAU6QDC9_9ECHI